ncbi:hypothetical protein AciX8_4836 [Granulicella mallensis MP5ACTX8]|uniref:Uncharacterized protein n=1 Tax=Granulicella mallensis (strain ATCC BAA-1857 / DSM 23137 / MP5ACTX8) TaxID=682795 RepID=G8NYP6_GRAMM|nr:hypothetical protein AciX8_4836 [Granulicella mallensis MP5ACTX8]
MRCRSRYLSPDPCDRSRLNSRATSHNDECVGRNWSVFLVGYCLPMVQIHVDTWRLDLSPLSGTFLSFNISAKPVWPSLSSLQSSEIEKLRDRSRAAQLDHFLEVTFSASSTILLAYDTLSRESDIAWITRRGYKQRIIKRMIAFGPVAEAAKGGHSSPTFDLCAGFAVLALTWVGYWRQGADRRISIWVALGVSAICAVFICSGLYALLQ